MGRRNISVFGHIYCREACAVCGKKAKKSYPVTHVNFVFEFKEITRLVPNTGEERVGHQILTEQRLSGQLCLRCAEEMSNKLDMAIQESRDLYAKRTA